MSKRISFISVQTSHVVSTKEVDLNRVRTGYEQVVAQQCSSTYAGIAKQDGVITHVDRANNILRVDYKDGSADVFSFGEEYTNISGMYITQHLICVVDVGDKVKKGDVLCYNDQYFKRDKYTKQLSLGCGVRAKVVLMEADCTLEDSNAITKRLGERLTISPTHTRDIVLTKNSVIHQYLTIGTHVKNTETILVFEDEDLGDMGSLTGGDISTLEMLKTLNKNMPKAKHSGEIVKIEAFYSCPISDMSESLAKLVNECNKSKQAKHKFSRGTNMEYDYIPPSVLPEGTKYKGNEFGDDTIVIQFYIKEDIVQGVGSKLVVASQLKSVTNEVLEEPILSESGVEIDMVFGMASVANRVVNSCQLVGSTNRVLEELQNQAVDMYFNS